MEAELSDPTPAHGNPASQQRYSLVSQLVETCPEALGEEIALVGSSGWGAAGDDYDLDLEFWVEHMPTPTSCLDWLWQVGAEEFLVQSYLPGELVLVTHYQDVWLDLTWRTYQAVDDTLRKILLGETVDREHFLQAWNVFRARSLRTTGRLENWQRRLAFYPEVVQERIIRVSSDSWRFPHHLEMLWTLAAHHELFSLDRWLSAHLQNGLRILFAVNRQWEPDWKHLAPASQLLAQAPPQLNERLQHVYEETQPERRITLVLNLVLEILTLVRPPNDVSEAIQNIQDSLHRHVPFPEPAPDLVSAKVDP
jgi:hypothetical protein